MFGQFMVDWAVSQIHIFPSCIEFIRPFLVLCIIKTACEDHLEFNILILKDLPYLDQFFLCRRDYLCLDYLFAVDGFTGILLKQGQITGIPVLHTLEDVECNIGICDLLGFHIITETEEKRTSHEANLCALQKYQVLRIDH